MNRREFLQRLGIGVGGAAVGAVLPMSAEGLDEVVIEAVEPIAYQDYGTALNLHPTAMIFWISANGTR